MLQVGGLKAAAKRTAFGDVSNTVKSLSNAQDDSAIAGKQVYQEIVKPVAVQEKSAARAAIAGDRRLARQIR